MLGRSRAIGKVVRAMAIVALATSLSGCYLVVATNHQQTDPDTRPWFCDSTGSTGGHHSPYYDGMEKGMLSWDDCLALAEDFDGAWSYVRQWPTLGDAEAAGFHRTVTYVSGMGTHHTMLGDFDPQASGFDPQHPLFPGTDLDENFDPTHPEFLMYGGNTSDAPLVGMAWYVRTDDGNPPEGFPGNNDWWHVHHRLCFTNGGWQVIGEDLTDEQCAARGATNVHLDDYYMVHAWILPGWQTMGDVFTNHHPCLLPGGIAAPDDPCWAEAASGGGGDTGH